MKKLTQYAKNGYDYKIIQRENNFAIARGESRISSAINWEVIEIQSHNGLTMGGVFMPATEFAPSNNQWGIKGWTASNEQQAQEIFNKRKCNTN
jgi:hypothetical protein